MVALALALLFVTQAPAPSPTAAPVPPPASPPQIAFPGQYAAAPADWKFPVWGKGCARLKTSDERLACSEFILGDWPRLSRYAAANRELAPPLPGMRRVVFFGDSITDNWSKARYGGFFPGRPYVNRGIGGETTGQMLIRFRPDVIDLHPKAVVILAGTNDLGGNNGPASDADIHANLTSIAELARANGIKVVMASLLPVSDDKPGPDGKPMIRTGDRPLARLRAINNWLADYARKSRHVYLDYATALSDANGFLRSDLNDDGIHPNAAGYAVMAPLAEKAITRALGTAR